MRRGRDDGARSAWRGEIIYVHHSFANLSDFYAFFAAMDFASLRCLLAMNCAKSRKSDAM